MTLALTMALTIGCGDDENAATSDGSSTGTETGGTAGTETSGNTAGDGDGDPTTTDPTTTGDGDGDPSCPLGSDGCPCTNGGGCDPGLMCDGDTCVPANPGDGDGAPGDGDGAPGDGDGAPGDGDGAPGDGDGAPGMPYGPCPNGDDAECEMGEICIEGNTNGQAWTLCTSGQCNGNMDCNATPDDVCGNPPGDGSGTDYCIPQACSMQNPCPMGMQCIGGGGNNPPLCLWPN